MLCLEGNTDIELDETSIFPTVAGHGVFFTHDLEIDFSQLKLRKNCRYLMIVYACRKTTYTHKHQDLFGSIFRELGYETGDTLTNHKHPLVYK